MTHAVRAALCAMFACMLFLVVGCAGQPESDGVPDVVRESSAASPSSGDAKDGSEGELGVGVSANAAESSAEIGQNAGQPGGDFASDDTVSLTFPTGWLIASIDGIEAGQPLQMFYLPGFDIEAHRDGKTVSRVERAAYFAILGIAASVVHAADNASAAGSEPADADSTHGLVSSTAAPGLTDLATVSANDPDKPDVAYVRCGQVVAAVDPGLLLVNMPDVLPNVRYDIVYSYSSTSRCAGEDIPGITGCRLEGYADGMQFSAYAGVEEFAVPCAYATTLKAARAADELEQLGYTLLVYDAYRPMSAQRQLSDALVQAYYDNEAIRLGLGQWRLTWYVANGASGHNFGTDLDVGLCDADGLPCAMPSAFDAFDETGHLTSYPMSAAAISPDAYCPAIADNPGCMALHQAFVAAGFTELASEWWHFGDEDTEAANRAVVGDAGLDFVAQLG